MLAFGELPAYVRKADGRGLRALRMTTAPFMIISNSNFKGQAMSFHIRFHHHPQTPLT